MRVQRAHCALLLAGAATVHSSLFQVKRITSILNFLNIFGSQNDEVSPQFDASRGVGEPRADPVKMGQTKARYLNHPDWARYSNSQDLWTRGLIDSAVVALTITNHDEGVYYGVLEHFVPQSGYKGDTQHWDSQLRQLKKLWAEAQSESSKRYDVEDQYQAVIYLADLNTLDESLDRSWKDILTNSGPDGRETLETQCPKGMWDKKPRETFEDAHEMLKAEVKKLAPEAHLQIWEHDAVLKAYPENSLVIGEKNVIRAGNGKYKLAPAE